MKKYIKKIPQENYRPILLALVISLGYLFTPIMKWLAPNEAILSSLIFFFIAIVLFLASLCDTLKSELDQIPIANVRMAYSKGETK